MPLIDSPIAVSSVSLMYMIVSVDSGLLRINVSAIDPTLSLTINIVRPKVTLVSARYVMYMARLVMHSNKGLVAYVVTILYILYTYICICRYVGMYMYIIYMNIISVLSLDCCYIGDHRDTLSMYIVESGQHVSGFL